MRQNLQRKITVGLLLPTALLLLLFALLWWQGGRAHRHTGFISGLFLIGYGLTRFIAEYFREPDAHLGLLALGLSMGQWLCVPMVVVGLFLVRRPGK